MLILAIDVHYHEQTAIAAAVSFGEWTDSVCRQQYLATIPGVAPYESGQFYKRELPCIIALLEEHNLQPDVIVIDGFVYLDGNAKPGLGKYLHDHLHGSASIIGVAKSPIQGIPEYYALYRGTSKTPLYVTCEGMALNQARAAISTMAGPYRMPQLLKQVDRLCRSANYN